MLLVTLLESKYKKFTTYYFNVKAILKHCFIYIVIESRKTSSFCFFGAVRKLMDHNIPYRRIIAEKIMNISCHFFVPKIVSYFPYVIIKFIDMKLVTCCGN
ncbi:hypothetical protein P717_21635 [Enterobacter kobei]|nr:hypothetical protein P717_21635 [Enterobacter kobei]